MKQPYQAPTLIANGDLAAHTRTTVPSPITLDGALFRKDPSFGTVGFGL
jgi:hypothetical protein